MTTDLIMQTFHLGKRFKSRMAVQDLNLAIPRGEVFGFLGPNGAGKSTTIRMILSLISPTTGHVELFGKSLRHHRSDVLSRVGGLVESGDFYLYLSAIQNLQIVGALRGGVGRREVEEVLDIVGLMGRARDRVKTYSHGMKQRLGIAQALLGNPQFIVLDEPTTGLDPQGIKEVRQLIREVSSERGITVFLSSHLLSEIEQTATSMAIINRGKLMVQGKVHDLLHARNNTVKVDARPVDQAVEVLRGLPFVNGVEQEESVLRVSMPLERTGTLATALVEAGVEVRALVPQRSLEEYFLSITEGATDISPHHRTPRG
jgi:ABC-type multidrug transport system ATPase subunit